VQLEAAPKKGGLSACWPPSVSEVHFFLELQKRGCEATDRPCHIIIFYNLSQLLSSRTVCRVTLHNDLHACRAASLGTQLQIAQPQFQRERLSGVDDPLPGDAKGGCDDTLLNPFMLVAIPVTATIATAIVLQQR
jgi:hypothetical protein